jgi:hypothetical protein
MFEATGTCGSGTSTAIICTESSAGSGVAIDASAFTCTACASGDASGTTAGNTCDRTGTCTGEIITTNQPGGSGGLTVVLVDISTACES